jgi:hypothetical protein
MKTKFQIIETHDYRLAVSNEKIVEEGDKNLTNGRDIFDYADVSEYSLDYANRYWQKVIAHQPLNNAPILKGVPLLPEMVVEDEVIRKLAQSYRYSQFKDISYGKEKVEAITASLHAEQGFYDGYKAATKTFSEDDVCDFVEWMNLHYRALEHTICLKDAMGTKGLLQQWNKSKIHKTPKWFVAEMEEVSRLMTTDIVEKEGWVKVENSKYTYQRLKTTTIDGKTYLVGTYE